ncbi:bifunctional precorrin-2 dehydrogenase/sirohydrochlorin ferrochelatase [Sphingobacterium sp. SGR-19]|uniref:precorrin-2 dehydrogenase/sirohydrochlorin ferrochelatase family protein n=1 Tax=Sphingobacterium sp. SGR-19 TaxID=2710886 RepID=UPI0013EC4922|nr:bifunctional precorrin-2 dehydrogenase/sirohydrochlorin ferrochelatase [Sphingobacterium sp. SGR-19]NGM63837.1 bifunctional precorrin-2 dehydrogenase/sirohydrochlorin ferrochelatase [Sphingobacterium sp. SGR-19]
MNELFPIYVKLHQIQTLLVGAGNVGLEKLQAILTNSPQAKVHVVAAEVSTEVHELIQGKGNIEVSAREFDESDIENVDLIILATNNTVLNANIRQLASKHHILLNVADKPSLCDFYLGSVVCKGNLKIGISTNGKSPTIAKRIKEFLNELLPEEIDETLELMGQLRDNLKGDFQEKIRALNAHTKDVLVKKSYDSTN